MPGRLRKFRFQFLALLLAFVFPLQPSAWACNVPVFRYALEHWQPDPYRVTLFHRGPLSPAEQALFNRLEEASSGGAANLHFRAVDAVQLDESDQPLVSALPENMFPRLVAQYPGDFGIEVPIWNSPLDETSVTGLVDSPLRQELVRRLFAGQTAVWLILESGKAEQDDQAVAKVEAELRKLAGQLKLPELTDAPEDNLRTGLELRIAFSTLRVARTAAERPLVEMLLRSEPDLAERSVPLVFPVFGRGRALWPLVGAGITAENIEHAATFLVGACSCQAKEQNPGFDLLLSADWPELLSGGGQPLKIAEKTPAAAKPVLVPIPSGSPVPSSAMPVSDTAPATVVRASLSLGLIAGGVALAAILLVVGLVIALLPRRQDGSRAG